jgi:hypothetical protein
MKIEPVLRVLERLGAPYALIGGYAIAAWGFARSTIDIHIDLLTEVESRLPDVRPDPRDTWRQVSAIEP